MNKSGCLAMVKFVLSAIPVHQLLVFAQPKKSLKAMEKFERGFLWAGRAAANGGHCHVNWKRVCRSISLGGLGVHDLERDGYGYRALMTVVPGVAWTCSSRQMSARYSSPPLP